MTKSLNDDINVEVFTSSFLHYESKNLINDNKLNLKLIEDEVPYTFVKTSTYETNGKDRIVNMISYYINILKLIRKRKKDNDVPSVIVASSPHPLALVAGEGIEGPYNR